MSNLIDKNDIPFSCCYEHDCIGGIEDCKQCEYYVCDYQTVDELPRSYDLDVAMMKLQRLRHVNFCDADDFGPPEYAQYVEDIKQQILDKVFDILQSC